MLVVFEKKCIKNILQLKNTKILNREQIINRQIKHHISLKPHNIIAAYSSYL